MQLEKIEIYLERFPWALPLASFSAGCASLVLVHRGSELAKITAVIVLLGWIWVFLQPFARKYMRLYTSKRLSDLLSIFVIQSLQQEILFFSMPFVLLSTTLHDAGQVVFAIMLMAAATVSTIDPLYEKYIATTTLASIAFQSFCSFVAALVVLPIVVQVPLGKSFYIALAFVIAWLVIAAPAILTSNYSMRGIAVRLLAILSIPLVLVAGREHIPAAGLHVSKSRVTSVVENHEPGAILSSVHQSELADGLYAYSSISAPKGLEQEIVFHWKHENYEEKISSQIIGGREEGFRTYSFKENFIEQSVGDWTIDITTAQGQLLERLEFVVYI